MYFRLRWKTWKALFIELVSFFYCIYFLLLLVIWLSVEKMFCTEPIVAFLDLCSCYIFWLHLGLCDMDKKYISRFFDFFSDFDFNHDFDTNRHALSYTSCFCTSYLSCTSCFALFFILLHILLFISFFYLYICSCVVLLLYNLYSLHCPLSGPDLIYISLLIIPCIIYHVTNKETLTFTVINAFCVNLKHISKGKQLDLSQKVVTCL